MVWYADSKRTSILTPTAPVIITGKGGNAVLISEEGWRSIQETMFFNPYKKSAGDLSGAYSRKLNIQYRVVSPI